jgi:NADPH:quinone reductase-like Zn-dependent oxidoreductase
MRAMAIDRFGGPEVLRMAELPIPAPGPGEVLIKVAYAGVNPADWKCREGWLARFFEYRFPFVLGFDAAGVVVKLGAGVSGLAAGQRVVACSKQGLGQWGSYAEYVVAATDGVAPLADHVPQAEAAALPTAGITAYEGLFESGRIGPGQAVLIHGGAGGVGSYAIQLARHAGARVAATCGPHNLDYVRGLGAELAIDHRAGRIAEAIAAWAPQGLDLVLDAVGQGSLPQAVELVRPGGVIAPIATLIADETPHDAAAAQRRGVRIVPTMSSYERSGAQLRRLAALCAEGVLRAPQFTVLPLEQAAEAQRRVQAGHVRGKLVLEVAGPGA